jgi:hypothetical protein
MDLLSTLSATLSSDFAARSAAETALRAADAAPGFALALLTLAREPSAPPGTRQSAAVLLKGLVIRRWDEDDYERFVGPVVRKKKG